MLCFGLLQRLLGPTTLRGSTCSLCHSLTVKLCAATATAPSVTRLLCDSATSSDAHDLAGQVAAVASIEWMLAWHALEGVSVNYRLNREITRSRRRFSHSADELQELLAFCNSDPQDEDGFGELIASAREDVARLRAPVHDVYHSYLDAVLQHPLFATEATARCNAAIVEICAGVGGAEASLFADDLYHMYISLANRFGWRYENINSSSRDESKSTMIAFLLEAGSPTECVTDVLHGEVGVHRVQRVPATERGGRVHTSTASVAVLPQVYLTTVDGVTVEPNDCDVLPIKKASGPGGQGVNTTSSTARVTHRPSGITVDCTISRDFMTNRKIAFTLIAKQLSERQMKSKKSAVHNIRSLQHGSGNRNERVRTYNFPQDRLTDHRIGFTTYGLETFMAAGESFLNCVERLQLFTKEERRRQLIETAQSFERTAKRGVKQPKR